MLSSEEDEPERQRKWTKKQIAALLKHAEPPYGLGYFHGVRFIPPRMSLAESIALDASRIASGHRPLRRTPYPAPDGSAACVASLQQLIHARQFMPAPNHYPTCATYTTYPSTGEKYIIVEKGDHGVEEDYIIVSKEENEE